MPSMIDIATRDGATVGMRPPRVVLVGSFVSFSARTMSLLQHEFPSYAFERVAGSALKEAITSDDLHLLICDESVALLALELSAVGPANIVVAFNDAVSVAALLSEITPARFPTNLSFLPMNVRLDAWLSIVGLLLLGEAYVPLDVLRQMGACWGRLLPGQRSVPQHEAEVSVAGPSKPDRVLQKLTDRERKVLSLVAQGKQNKVIADELDMSEHTVKLHVHHIIAKFGVRNRTEVVSQFLSRVSAQGKA